MPDETLQKALTIAKSAVIESYRNGIEHGRLAGEKKPPKGKPWQNRR